MPRSDHDDLRSKPGLLGERWRLTHMRWKDGTRICGKACPGCAFEERPTVQVMSGPTGEDEADGCTCGGKLWCLGCQERQHPTAFLAPDCTTPSVCPAPTPEAP
jgi:hypothetical protein